MNVGNVIIESALKEIAAPDNLTATSTTNDIVLKWKDNSDNEEGFTLERSQHHILTGYSEFTEIDNKGEPYRGVYWKCSASSFIQWCYTKIIKRK